MLKVKWYVLAVIGMELLNGCFNAESPCHYFELVENNLKNNQWYVDTLHLFVFDSTTLYRLDSTYTNYGAIRFNPYITDNCTDTGIMALTLPDGQIVKFSFNFHLSNSYYNVISLYTSSTLDGYTKPYNEPSYFDPEPTKTTISYVNGNEFGRQNIGYTRYWEFTLSKK